MNEYNMLRILNTIVTNSMNFHRIVSPATGLPMSKQFTICNTNLSFSTTSAAVFSKHNNIFKFYDSNYDDNQSSITQKKKFSTRTVHPEENIGILKKVLNKVGFTANTKPRLKVTSYILYENVADHINYLEFFEEFSLPNTFNSWFLVTELHVWMLLLRSMAEGSETGDDGRFLRNGIVEAMWGDVNTRAKKLGANNPSGTRAQIEILSEQFQAALIAYDEGIMCDDKTLAGSLWRRFFEQNCDKYTQLEKLVKYTRKQVQMLDSMQRDEFLVKPKIRWSNLNEL